MADTIEGKIAEALFGRLQSLVFSPALPVLLPNEQKAPPGNHRYLRAQFVPNVANRFLIDSDGPHQHLGLLQVSVYWAKGRGEVEPRDVAGAVAAHFPCDLTLGADGVSVRITKRPDVRDMLVEDAAIQIPVIVSWEVLA